MSKPTIVSFGAGNVANHLIPALFKKHYPIQCVYSRSLMNASALGKIVNSEFTDNMSSVPRDADIYLITLTDHAIRDAADVLQDVKGIVLHTAGSVGTDVFSGKVERYGVLYPLQTFSKQRKILLNKVPVLVEASDNKTLQSVTQLAEDISDSVMQMNSDLRRRVHLAAVFSCNFVNHMLTCTHDILSEENIDFTIFHPLIKETIARALEDNPASLQTGPAVRGNQETINSHVSMLKDRSNLQNLYTFVSKAIFEYHSGLKKQNPGNE